VTYQGSTFVAVSANTNVPPTPNTTSNLLPPLANTAHVGAIPALQASGQNGVFLRGDNTWAAPPAGGGGGAGYYGTDTTNSLNYVVTVGAGFALTAGVVVYVLPTNSNSGANPTLNVNGTGVKAIVTRGNAALVFPDEIGAAKLFGVMYDGTSWRLVTPVFRSYSQNDPNTATIECAGFDGINAYAGLTGSSAGSQHITLAHLKSGIPVVLSFYNASGGNRTIIVSVTDEAGTAQSVYASFSTGPGGASFNDFGSPQTMGNNMILTMVGSLMGWVLMLR
jgi:hypothetical protein